MNPTEQHSKGELKAKGVRGILWTGLSKFSIQGLQLLTTVILARLLTKEDFGVIGMAAIITVAIGMFAEHGLSASLIQKKQIHERHLSSIFWAGLVIGAILSGCGAISPLTSLQESSVSDILNTSVHISILSVKVCEESHHTFYLHT